MKALIYQLSNQNVTLEIVGGKGVSLTRLINAGIPVPDGFHVTTEAYRQFVTENNLQEKIQDALKKANIEDSASLEEISQNIGGLFANGVIPSSIEKTVRDAYHQLSKKNGNDIFVAIRSSATAEDLPNASFAGQQETYLNIRGEDAVLQAVKNCWASLWTARAIAYRIKNHIDQESVMLAVVVQILIFAESAGVMFTANPVTGQRDEALINAAWGLGESIVSGAVSPDTLAVNKKKLNIISRLTAEKLVMTCRTDSGTEEYPVPLNLQKKPVLSKKLAIELVKLGNQIESLYGVPMDIEWAYSNGQFFILQARPITSLPPEWVRPVPNAIYARGSLAEHIPSPVTPLFATLGLDLANIATNNMWEAMMGSDYARKILAGDSFYVAVNGFVYGGMYLGFKESLMVAKMSLSQTGFMLRRSVQRWQDYRKKLIPIVAVWEQKNIGDLSSHDLLTGVKEVFGAACEYFTNIQSCLPAASMSEILFTKFYNSFIKKKGDPAAILFLLGFDTIAVKSEQSLYDIAVWAQNDPALKTYIQNADAKELWTESGPTNFPEETWKEWRKRFNSHIENFGKIAYEFDFANPTPAESPEVLLKAIKAFINGNAGNPYERQQTAIKRRNEATQLITNRTGWPLRNWFLKLLNWSQRTNPMREDSIADMGMGHPILRKMFSELARRLIASNAFEQIEDIYWLEKKELEACIETLENKREMSNYTVRIKERKSKWSEYFHLSPPVILPERSNWSKLIYGSDSKKIDGKTILTGAGTSSGIVTAPACILFGPQDFGNMKPGNVLVAVTTTPAWTPLFALASAVVTDIGGPLSHSSIVAREYNIPAVMAVRGASRLIKNGQMITVDGGKGTVTL